MSGSPNYSKGKPLGNNGVPQFEAPPPVRALARNGNTNQSASSVITLTDDTTAIEIGVAGTGGAMMKWISASDTSGSVFSISSVGATSPPNFDHFIAPGRMRRFVVPVEGFKSGLYYYGSPSTIATTSQAGENIASGLYKRVAIVTAGGVASVFVSEYGNMV